MISLEVILKSLSKPLNFLLKLLNIPLAWELKINFSVTLTPSNEYLSWFVFSLSPFCLYSCKYLNSLYKLFEMLIEISYQDLWFNISIVLSLLIDSNLSKHKLYGSNPEKYIAWSKTASSILQSFIRVS